MNRILLISIGLLFVFAWFDTRQVVMLKSLDSSHQIGEPLWDLWWQIGCSAQFLLFMLILGAIGLIWYVLTKDKSEALALFLTPAVMIYMGTQDLIYYMISPIDTLQANVGCWADIITPVRIISDIFREACPSSTAFALSGLLGILFAYLIYNYLQKKW